MKPTYELMLKFYFYTQSFRTQHVYRSIWIVLKELLNINKAYITTWMDY